MTFFPHYRLDDFGAFALAERLIFKKFMPILNITSDYGLPRCLDAGNEARGTGVGEVLQGWSNLASESIAGIFAMPDDDFFESFDTPKVPILTDAAEIKTGDTEGL